MRKTFTLLFALCALCVSSGGGGSSAMPIPPGATTDEQL